MALEQLRKRWEAIALPIVSRFGRTNPAVLTWLALPVGVAASVLVFTAPKSDTGALMLLGSAFLIAFSMVLDGLEIQFLDGLRHGSPSWALTWAHKPKL